MRKAFNFFNSYWQISKELSDKDRLAFYDALLYCEFTGDFSRLEKLTGMAKFAYISQKHSIESQVKGYVDAGKRWNTSELDNPILPPTVGGIVAPTVQEQVQEEVQEKGQVQVIVEHLNITCKTEYKHNTKKTISLIEAKTKEGYTIEDFKIVIDFKNNQWGNDKDMKHYLRPETLFGNKFESYLQAAKKEAPKQTSTFVSCLKPEDLTY